MGRAELSELLSDYHYALDDRKWDTLRSMMADDFSMELPSGVVLRGPDETIAFMSRPRTESSTLSHHLSNVVVDSLDADEAKVRSKYLAVCSDGTVLSGTYTDTVVAGADGWLLGTRVVRRVAPAT